MSTLIHETDLADFTVICGDKTWRLHANILAVQSPFFRAAITNNMMENLEMKIDIKALDTETMEEVINYMYGKPIGNAPIDFLFEAAERFQMSDLKKDVAKLAKQKMTLDNVVEFARLAERYNYDEFLEECANFIVENDIYLKEELSQKLTKMVFGILAKAKEELKESKEELKESKEELQQTREELCLSEYFLDQFKEELKNQFYGNENDLDQIKDELEETKHELEEAKQELEEAKEELEETKQDLQETREELQVQLWASEYDLDQIKDELEETKQELQGMVIFE